MLASLTGLIGLIVFVIVAIISSLLKRKEEGEFELPPELKPRRDKPPRDQSAPARSWEEQLRQLLEDRSAPTPPPIVRPMPPPIGEQPPVFSPRTRRPVVRPVTPPEEIEPHIEVELPVPRAQIEPTFQKLAGLTDSETGYAQASHLQERVAQHLADVTRHRVEQTTVSRRPASSEVREAINMVRDRKAVRAAILTSIILGPPRALEV